MDNVKNMAVAAFAALVLTVLGVLVLVTGDLSGLIALGGGTIAGLLGVQAARRHRKGRGR